MDLKLTRKVVFIARASRGIGYGIAEAFLQEGARGSHHRAASYVPKTAESALLDQFPDARLLALRHDRDRRYPTRVGRGGSGFWGQSSITVANVGGGEQAMGFQFDDDVAVVQENLTGSVRLGCEMAQRLRGRHADQRQDANIIAISSIAGVDAMGGLLAYGASKAAINRPPLLQSGKGTRPL